MAEKSAKKILIIEDEKELVMALSTLFKSQGYSTVAAYDALYGISSAHQEKPDLIILDLGLPAGGGFYVLKNLKDSVETSDIPIFILTAKQEPDLEERAKELGAAKFFPKPFDPPALLNQIKEILNT